MTWRDSPLTTAPVVRRWCAGLLIVMVVLAFGASPAAAHATLVSTFPAEGAVLDEAPEQVSITFNEAVEVEPDSLRVVDATGSVVSGPAEADGATVAVEVDDDATGWFAASWQVVSVDGHPLSGGWTFRVGEGSETAPEDLIDLAGTGSGSSTTIRVAWGASQWASAVAALALLGTAFVVLVAPATEAQRTLVVVLAVVGVVASVLAAGLNGPQISPDTAWFDGPASKYYLARAAALAVGSGALWLSWRHNAVVLRLGAAIVLAAGVCVTVLSGHARADGKVTALVVMAHLVVAGAWLGALPAVALAAWKGGDSAHTVLSRFSRAAVWLAGAVLVLGSAAAWLLSGGIDTVAPRWGALLVAKVALVVLAILAGGWTRFNVLKDWASRTRREIRMPLVAEVALFAAVVVASIALTHNGPPQELRLDGPVELSVTDETEGVVVSLVIDPGTVGTNDIHLYVTEPSGLPVEVEEATVELSAPDLGIAPLAQTLSDLGAGHFSGATGDIGAPGAWEVRVVVRPTPFTQVVLDETFEVD